MQNNDLISRSALKKYLKDYRFDFALKSDFAKALEMIDCAPAVDAVVLPCKIGDRVYAIRNYKGVKHTQEGIVAEMFFTQEMKLHIVVKHVARGEWGKTVFATQGEAEAALTERNAKHGNISEERSRSHEI